MDYELRHSILLHKENYDVIEKIFATRGIYPDLINRYLHPTDEDMNDPLLLDNVEEGIKLLIKHISNNDIITFIVDADADGFCSSALFINYLNFLFPAFTQNNIKYLLHTGKQHGLSDMMERIPKESKLVIIPDAGSNDYEYHKSLRAAGIDVLVIDHHEAEYVSEDAVVINNQLCDYPNKTLCGGGVVLKVCEYIDELMGTSYSDQLYDLAAVALISDMMDLRNLETKRIIDKGLANIRNPFLQQMTKVQNYSISKAGGLCPFSVSFYITPQINGAVRMGTQEEKTLIFESMLDFKGYTQIPSTKRGCKGQFETVAEQACRTCTNIKRHQTKAVEETQYLIESIIQDKELMNNKIIAVKLDKNHSINRNLTGLIANRLMAEYQHPILILSEIEENGQKAWAGSGRGYEAKGFHGLKDFLQESNLVYLAQGHQNAMGVGIYDSDFDDFIQYSNNILEKCTFKPCTKVDFIWHINDFKASDIIDIASLNLIWGQELEKPYIVLENLAITPDRVTLMSRDKKPTIKIELPNGVNLIKFGSSEEEYENLTKYPAGSININVLGTCAINEWNGKITPQFLVEDYEIVGESQYYF